MLRITFPLHTKKECRSLFIGLGFVSPWLIGLVLFNLYPIVMSLYYSFTDFIGINTPTLVGLKNYRMMWADPLFWVSVKNTLVYTAMNVTAVVVVSILIALVLSYDLREISVWRSLIYFPSILPVFATSFIWMWVFHPQFGILNSILASFGIPGPGWYDDPAWSKPTLVLMSLWGSGNVTLIFLASMKDIPKDLYEAASLDGAGVLTKIWHITLPSISPVILFNGIMAINNSLQIFAQSYIITGGGPSNSTLFYTLYLYRQAFTNSRMGQACAMAWVLMLFSVCLAVLVLKTSRRFIYYRED